MLMKLVIVKLSHDAVFTTQPENVILQEGLAVLAFWRHHVICSSLQTINTPLEVFL